MRINEKILLTIKQRQMLTSIYSGNQTIMKNTKTKQTHRHSNPFDCILVSYVLPQIAVNENGMSKSHQLLIRTL